jgi:hypothetical protein
VLERLAFGRAGRDGVDADAAVGELERLAASQLLECGLGGAVLADAGCRLAPERARDVHDRAARLLEVRSVSNVGPNTFVAQSLYTAS